MNCRAARRRPWIPAAAALAAAWLVVQPRLRAAEPVGEPAVPALVAAARQAGLRVLEGDHLALATDRPPRPGDGLDLLPRIFDEAFASWCRHYGLDPAEHVQWRAFGCLVVDRERFRAAGLLPDAEVSAYNDALVSALATPGASASL